ncbi:c-type cytochrome [Maribacter algarum]|uniref:C-type cytochrome n=1 Tax=Maribacter algarum (ex Zhang et al. 2020) TaxID=2578118 RepID=A0A5S3PUB4_9FLAO|nr:PVC-type heme-binding CxxCH protein [Maribacter algarum]TMM58596.1 c-type cytochrome [Maribacter algarum]
MKRIVIVFIGLTCLLACKSKTEKTTASVSEKVPHFKIEKGGDFIKVFRQDESLPLVTQNVKSDFRPFIHPIIAPESEVELTQYSPGHHPHQTGLYWGFTRVNGTGADSTELKKWFYDKNKPEDIQQKIGRDFFHNPGSEYWQRVSTQVLIVEGPEVKWQSVYNMLDSDKTPILKETQIWTFKEKEGKYLLSLEWQGEALTDISINEFDYGGLFLRMPWKEGIEGEVENAARQRNEKAEGKRAMWVDAGMEIEGLDEWGHIAIFDHPDNDNFPQTWRVDGQLGIGPVGARMGDWHIKKGEIKTIQHQIVAYSGKLNPVEMNDLWGDYAGDDGLYKIASLWNIARQEGRDAKLLSPQEAVDAMTIKEGYQVNAYASEPMITQPMAFCWDDRGRMWIAENRDYENRQEGFSNSGDSRILILEDTDRDGVVDSRKVFLEGIPFPSAIAIGHDGLFLGAPPNMLFVPDKDGDDKADVDDIEVLLTGWGIRDRHETINSLHWGPDGWLYGLEGFATPSVIRKPKGKGKIYKHREAFPEDLLDADGVDINGGVWRYHPIKKKFEVVAHGFSNPWGIDYDAKGQLLISACVIPHLFHIIQGGIYHRQGGQHFNPYAYEDIQTIVDHRHRSAHGGARIYQSDAFPKEDHGKVFMANIHEHAVLSDVLHKNGSGFSASHGDEFMMANNAQWIGFSMEVGPEGGLYVLDWHDADICGNDVINKDTGRVFRIMPEKSLAENWTGRYDDLTKKSDTELVELQLSKSNWHAQRARVILQNRANKGDLDAAAISKAEALLKENSNEDTRLRALWTLHVTNNISSDDLIVLMKDKQEYVRGWAIQFLVEDGQPSQKGIEAMTALAKNESSAVVRLYLASALQRIGEENRWSIATSLAKHKEDIDDPNIPLMLWFGIEPLIAKDPVKALELAGQSQIPSIIEKIGRRLVDGEKLEQLVAGVAEKSKEQIHLLNGMLSGLESRADLKEPSNWSATYKKLQSDSNLAVISDEIAQRFGSVEAAIKMMAIVNNPNAEVEQQQNAIKNLAVQQRKELETILPKLLQNPKLRLDAIRAIAAYNNEDLGKLILKEYPNYSVLEKQEVIQTLASRPVYGWPLALAIKDGSMPKKDIPAYVALQLKRVVGNGFVEIWGPIDEISGDKQGHFSKYQRLLSDAAISKANLTEGEAIYQRTCSACHMMHGEGGVIGPDLTGSNRTNTAYLLSNILNPNGDIQNDYKTVVITTNDGRTYSGNIISENDRNVTLRVVGQDPISISTSKIQNREVTTKSMMPDGLLNNLTDEEVINLVAYLKELNPPEKLNVSL